MEVVQLHKEKVKKSKHDIAIENGTKFLRFEMHDCGQGDIHVSYFIEIPIQEHLKNIGVPAIVFENIANPEKTHNEVVFEKYITRKWYHKLLGVSIEKLILKFIKESKKKAEDQEHGEKAIEIIKRLVEKSEA
jgi:hypothetical protein